MNVSLLNPSQLTTEHVDRWNQLRQQSADFGSPFFSLDFVCAVAQHRTSVSVAVIHASTPSRIDGFWAFERQGRQAVPVADRLNDFHGILAPADNGIDLRELLQATRISSFRFHHLANTHSVRQACFAINRSPFIDLEAGAATYLSAQKKAHRRTFKDQRRRWRMLQARVDELGLGSLRFEFQVSDPQTLEQLLSWKVAQYRRTGQPNAFAVPWTRSLLECLHAQDDLDAQGVLSGLFAGDRPIALHFGLQSGDHFHCWFPAYDTEFGRWSPGLQLWIKLIEAAPGCGIRRIDFGSGPESFKVKLANAHTTVGEGTVACSHLSTLAPSLPISYGTNIEQQRLQGTSETSGG